MVLTVGYWNLHGLGEPIRYLLHYSGQQFVDKRYDIVGAPTFESTKEWFEKDKPQLAADFPNLPYLIDGDIVLTQVSVQM